MYTELVDGPLTQRNKNARIVHLEDVGYEATDHERYLSLFQYESSIRNHFDVTGSVSGYKGEYYMNVFWIDIDNSSDLKASHDEAKKLVAKLISEYLVLPQQIYICFSGCKGFHIGLHSSLFGGFASSCDLPSKIKRLVSTITQGIGSVDIGIYNQNRSFRAINSCHPKSGLYKIGITYDDLMNKSLDEIMFDATEPNVGFRFEAETLPQRVNKKLAELWEFASYSEDFSHEISDSKVSPSSSGLFSPATEGERNNKLFKQACMLFDKSQFRFGDVLQITSNFNIASSNPIPETELYNIVRSAQQRTVNIATSANGGKTWFALHEQIPDILNALDDKSGNYNLVFDEFNELIKGDMKGKLVVVAGQGGTKKSIFAQEMLFANARSGMRGIYNNQEMSKNQFLKRSINMYRTGYYSKKLWDEFKEMYIADKEEAAKKVQDILKDDFSKRIIVDYKLAASSTYYRELIEQVEKAYGRIDMLVVDGLSMMMDTGGEKDSAEKHTRELKYLANELGIPVIALVHVTKDIPRHTRDLTPYLRGSGKIYDNADMFISCSLVVDQGRTNGDDIVYRTDIGYMRLYDKRESGETINVIYDFDVNTLRMTSSGVDPSTIEFKTKNKYLNADRY